MPRPRIHTPMRTSKPAAMSRRPPRVIWTRQASAQSAERTVSAFSTGSEAWMSVYDAPKTTPRAE